MSRIIVDKRQGLSRVIDRVIARAHGRARCICKLSFGRGVLAPQIVILTPFAPRKVSGALCLVGVALAACALSTLPGRASLCTVFGWRYA